MSVEAVPRPRRGALGEPKGSFCPEALKDGIIILPLKGRRPNLHGDSRSAGRSGNVGLWVGYFGPSNQVEQLDLGHLVTSNRVRNPTHPDANRPLDCSRTKRFIGMARFQCEPGIAVLLPTCSATRPIGSSGLMDLLFECRHRDGSFVKLRQCYSRMYINRAGYGRGPERPTGRVCSRPTYDNRKALCCRRFVI